jgi:competence protein CoiA
MWYAIDVRTQQRVRARPGISCICPLCQEPVIPKCGDLVPWHFAHKSNHDCDRFAERESEWHLAWKLLAPPDRREVVMGEHRADVVTPNGRTVVELQHSPISPAIIEERESFYRRPSENRWMVWLFDVRDCQDRFVIRRNASQSRPDESLYVWKHARKALITARAPVYLDIWGDPEPIVQVWRWLPERADTVEDSITGMEMVERTWPRAFIGRRVERSWFIKTFFTGEEEELVAE